MMEEAARLQIYRQGLYLFLRFNHLFFLLLIMILGKVSSSTNDVETTNLLPASRLGEVGWRMIVRSLLGPERSRGEQAIPGNS